MFDDIAARLSDGRRYLLGERFTAADLTFAALAAPMLLPARYGSPLPPPEAMPPGLAREVERLRVHPAGTFADRLYTQERARLAPAPLDQVRLIRLSGTPTESRWTSPAMPSGRFFTSLGAAKWVIRERFRDRRVERFGRL